MSDERAGLKALQRANWSAGDSDAIAELFWDVGAVVADAAAIEPGTRVLDVATGTGNAAIRAAQAGSQVVGLNLTPELFQDAQASSPARAGHVRADLRALVESFDAGDGELRSAAEYLLVVGLKP
jgi:protein-L-isoaspartate O-methyltransferase